MIKKGLIIFVVVCIIVGISKHPDSAAISAKDWGSGLRTVADGLATFFTNLVT